MNVVYHYGKANALVTNGAFPILKHKIIALVGDAALLHPFPPADPPPVPVSARLALIKANCCTYSFFWVLYIYIYMELLYKQVCLAVVVWLAGSPAASGYLRTVPAQNSSFLETAALESR